MEDLSQNNTQEEQNLYMQMDSYNSQNFLKNHESNIYKKKTTFDDILEQISPSELYSMHQFCKSVESLSISKLQEIISAYATIYVHKPPEIKKVDKSTAVENINTKNDKEHKDVNKNTKNDKNHDKNISKAHKEENDQLDEDLFGSNPKSQKGIQKNKNQGQNMIRDLSEKILENSEKEQDPIFIEKRLLGNIIRDIIQNAKLSFHSSEEKDKIDFDQLLKQKKQIKEIFRDYLNDSHQILINEDKSMNPQKCIDQLLHFSRHIDSNYRVLEAINKKLQSYLQQDIEKQLQDLDNQNQLDHEFKQFYDTLANFNKDDNTQAQDQKQTNLNQLQNEGQLSQQQTKVSMVSDFKQLLKEYKQVQYSSDEDLKQKLDELKQRLENFQSQIPSTADNTNQNLIDALNQQDSKLTQFEEFQKKKEEEEKLKDPKIKEQLQKKREVSLMEIFKFYATQSVLLNDHPTFDQQSQEQNKLNLQFFLKFCVDFKIPGDKKLHSQTFKKKVYRECTYLEFNTFKDCLIELFRIHNDKEILEKERELQDLSKDIQKYEQQEYQDFVDQYKSEIKSNQPDDQEERVQLDIEKARLDFNNLEQKLNEFKNRYDFLELAYQHLNIDNRKYYVNTMKGFHKPFWIKEVKMSADQQFLDNSYTGHTNNGVTNNRQPSQTMSRNDQTFKQLQLGAAASLNENINSKSPLDVTNNKIANSDQKQTTLKIKKHNDQKTRSEIREMMLKKIRDQRQGVGGGINGKSISKEAFYNLEQLRNVKNPKELLSAKDKDIESIEKLIGIDPADLNDGYEFTFKTYDQTQTSTQIQPTILAEHQQKIVNNHPQQNNQKTLEVTSKSIIPALTQSQSKQNLMNAQLSTLHQLSPIKSQNNNPKIFQQNQQYVSRTAQVAKSIDMKSKDYYTKILQRANEIDNTEKSIEKQKRENQHNIHMKRLSVNRQVINNYNNAHNLSAVNKSVDLGSISGINKNNNRSLLRINSKEIMNQKTKQHNNINNLNNLNSSQIKL